MLSPNRKTLARREPGIGLWQATHIHPNRRSFKYLWQIYTIDSPWEDDQFFANAPVLCTHDAMRTIEALAEAGQAYLVYNRRLPRRGADVPFDPEHPRWRGHEFACAYDDDLDPVWNGFK